MKVFRGELEKAPEQSVGRLSDAKSGRTTWVSYPFRRMPVMTAAGSRLWSRIAAECRRVVAVCEVSPVAAKKGGRTQSRIPMVERGAATSAQSQFDRLIEFF